MNYVCEKDNAERGVFTASTENTASSLKHLASVLSVLKSARRKHASDSLSRSSFPTPRVSQVHKGSPIQRMVVQYCTSD